jgi:hypothetical protein
VVDFRLFLGVVALLLGMVRGGSPPSYTWRLPPDTVALHPPRVEDRIQALERCFGRPMPPLRFYTSDQALGWTWQRGYEEPAQGRFYWFGTWGAVVLQTPYQHSLSLLDHELRHAIGDRVGMHPTTIFSKECP